MRICRRWNTHNFIIREAENADVETLNRICSSWEDKIIVEGEAFPQGYIENCISNGDLPPIKGADISNYYFMVIQRINGEIIGFFDLYHGYPNNETIWISIFMIDKNAQGNSCGEEVIKSICVECKKQGWKSIGLSVYLKNWKGLRFWTNNGFDKIIGVYGDKKYSETTFSIIGLQKELNYMERFKE